ncbi:hypothetical protein JOD52_002900 [Brachybacterium muris]|uniref:hypothetical protein n=1 Tax=Brachybacterium muris TaxID=219301 RepID=UPI00195D8791|nr:hypothetical protein [Brachybacterium muris]MBM7502060.1 hypothetical protein [Brachybacterium muris]
MPAGASGPHRGGYWPPSARSAVPKSKIRWLPRLRILSEALGLLGVLLEPLAQILELLRSGGDVSTDFTHLDRHLLDIPLKNRAHFSDGSFYSAEVDTYVRHGRFPLLWDGDTGSQSEPVSPLTSDDG